MRTRNALTRLAAAAPPAEPLLDAGEEDRILARILASPRPAAARSRSPRLRFGAVVGGAVAVAAAVALVSTGVLSGAKPYATRRHAALSGSEIKLADYHFKTPAGFKASDTSCAPSASGGRPVAVLNSFAAAASADGGCVEAFLMAPGSSTAPAATPAGAVPVAVGDYQGYYVSSDSTLYVALKTASGPAPYLVLYAQGLTEDQLIAVAQSGLPSGSAASSNQVVHN